MKIKLNDLVEEWKLYNINLRNFSENSIKAYSLDLKNFLHFSFQESEDILKSDLSNISSHTIRLWILSLRNKSIKASSLSRKISSLKNFFHWLENTHNIFNSAISRLESPKKDKNLPRPLTINDIKRLFSAFENKKEDQWIISRNQAIFLLLYTCGLRISEALDLKANALPLNTSIFVKGKGKKEGWYQYLILLIKRLKNIKISAPSPIQVANMFF